MLTKRQQEIFDFLIEFQHRMGRTPSGPEIAAHFGFKDPSPAYQHLQLMEKKGYVELIRSSQGRLMGIKPNLRIEEPAERSWAVLGTIPAGPLSEVLAVESTKRIDRIDDLIPELQPGDFFLAVSGDSMIEAGLMPGQYVIVRPGIEPRNGDVCAVWVEGQGSTLKQVFFEDGMVRLQPANSAYRAQTYSPDIVRVQGVLVAALSIEKYRRPTVR